MLRITCVWLLVAAVGCSAVPAAPPIAQPDLPATPSELYQELYRAVQVSRVYPDGKTFADARALSAPARVLAAYRREKNREGFRLSDFVAAHFETPSPPTNVRSNMPGESLEQHIDRLWQVLERRADPREEYSSRISLPYRYVVPGGRFRELYYWDSYFTMLGLIESGRRDLVADMMENFARLVDRFGHIPNGTRTYYVSRSQPPFFALMVELLAAVDGPSVYTRYLPQLKREYAFWMQGSDSLRPGQAHRRVVRLPDGAVLNRYWDDHDTPRDESYAEDLETARASSRRPAEVHRDLRAAAESGWDFSSRWLAEDGKLSSIHTTDFVPPDLNSLLFRLEVVIEHGCRLSSDARCAREFRAHADARLGAIAHYLWSDDLGAFTDYDFRAGTLSKRLSAATLYPLFVGACRPEHAKTVATTARRHLIRAHGVVTSVIESGQQWDAPNGWAPIQWIAVSGLSAYGESAMAQDIARRWIAANLALFQRERKMVEKYDVDSAVAGSGGEYPAQDGFGWTNGVLRKLLAMYPGLDAAPRPVAR